MSKHGNNDKQAFEDYLKGSSEVSDSYAQLPDQVPPSAVDDVILVASRRAVQARPQAAFSAFYQRWKGPMSMAASLFLCVGLVTVYYQQSDEMMLRQIDPVPVPAESMLNETLQSDRRQAMSAADADQSNTLTPAEKQTVQRHAAKDTVAGRRTEMPNVVAKALSIEQPKREVVKRPTTRPLHEDDAALSLPETEESYVQAPVASQHRPASPVSSSQKKNTGLALNSPAEDVPAQSGIKPESRKASRMQDDLGSDPAPAMARGLVREDKARTTGPEEALSRPLLAAETDALLQREKVAKQAVMAQKSSTELRDKQKDLSRTIAAAEEVLHSISRYRASGHFQRADSLLNRFHQQFPEFPPAHRERILDSVAPLMSMPEQH